MQEDHEYAIPIRGDDVHWRRKAKGDTVFYSGHALICYTQPSKDLLFQQSRQVAWTGGLTSGARQFLLHTLHFAWQLQQLWANTQTIESLTKCLLQFPQTTCAPTPARHERCLLLLGRLLAVPPYHVGTLYHRQYRTTCKLAWSLPARFCSCSPGGGRRDIYIPLLHCTSHLPCQIWKRNSWTKFKARRMYDVWKNAWSHAREHVNSKSTNRFVTTLNYVIFLIYSFFIDLFSVVVVYWLSLQRTLRSTIWEIKIHLSTIYFQSDTRPNTE